MKCATALLLTVLGACGASNGAHTEVRLHIDIAPELNAALLRVRVFDTDRLLVSNRLQNLDDADLPIVVPLTPDGDAPERSYHVVMELLGRDGTALGTQRVVGAYARGEQRRVPVRFDSACASHACAGNETCRAASGEAACSSACIAWPEGDDAAPVSVPCTRDVYVDGAAGEDAPGPCLGPEAPCATVFYALDTYLGDGEGGVINVAGEVTYGPFAIPARSSGTADVPTVVRAWPGRGRPVFDGRGEETVIGTCCSENSANHFVLEGLDVINGYGRGIQLHGRAVRNVQIRDCAVTGTTLLGAEGRFVGSAVEVGGIVVRNGASNVSLIANRIHGSVGTGETPEGSPFGVHGISVNGTGIRIERNRMASNSGRGVFALGNDLSIHGNDVEVSGASGIYLRAENSSVQDNWICASTVHGIELRDCDGADVLHNSVVGSALSGASLGDGSSGVRVRANIFAFHEGPGLGSAADGSSEPNDANNLYWMNADGAYENTSPDGMDWVDEFDPAFANIDACDLRLGEESGAANLLDAPLGARPEER